MTSFSEQFEALMNRTNAGFYIVTTRTLEEQHSIHKALAGANCAVYNFPYRNVKCSCAELLRWSEEREGARVFFVTNLQNALRTVKDIRIFSRACRVLAARGQTWVWCMTEQIGIRLNDIAGVYRHLHFSIQFTSFDEAYFLGLKGTVEPPSLSFTLQDLLDCFSSNSCSEKDSEISKTSPLYFYLLECAAYAHFERGKARNLRKSVKYYAELAASLAQVYGEDHPGIAKAENNIGSILYDYYYSYQTLYYFDRALSLRERVLGVHNRYTANTYMNTGYVYRGAKQFKRAEEYFLLALEAYKTSLGHEHYYTMRTLFAIGQVLESQQRYTEALGYYTSALHIISRHKYFGSHWIQEDALRFVHEKFPHSVEARYIEALCSKK